MVLGRLELVLYDTIQNRYWLSYLTGLSRSLSLSLLVLSLRCRRMIQRGERQCGVRTPLVALGARGHWRRGRRGRADGDLP